MKKQAFTKREKSELKQLTDQIEQKRQEATRTGEDKVIDRGG